MARKPERLSGRIDAQRFEERVFVGSDGYIKYARGDGSFWSFGVAPTGWAVAAPANESATLTQGSSYWTITSRP